MMATMQFLQQFAEIAILGVKHALLETFALVVGMFQCLKLRTSVIVQMGITLPHPIPVQLATQGARLVPLQIFV
jgi:hypothetical protein